MAGQDDVVFMLSFVAYTATRSKTHGSWFIRLLVATFYKHANHYDVRKLFDIVSSLCQVLVEDCRIVSNLEETIFHSLILTLKEIIFYNL